MVTSNRAGNLKSSNVLLTPDYEPLLVDYGLCSLISSIQSSQTLAAYKSPEAIQHYDISPKCDVCCLGRIILEILTGKIHPQFVNNGNGDMDLVQCARSAISEGKETELFDPDMVRATDFLGEMEQLLLHIGFACTNSNPNQRLDVREAIKRIEGICVRGCDQRGTMAYGVGMMDTKMINHGRLHPDRMSNEGTISIWSW